MVRAVALIPFRSAVGAKRRLAGVLSPGQRAALARAMLLDVIDALEASMTSPLIAIVSQDPDIALPQACLRLADHGEGLNEVVAGAFADVRDAFGADVPVLLVPADVPLLRPSIVDHAFDALAAGVGIVLAAAQIDGGTNLLGQAAACPVAPRFGTDSFRAHLNAALAAGLAVTTIEDPDVGRDIDRPDDLIALAASPHSTRSARLAQSWLDAAPGFGALARAST